MNKNSSDQNNSNIIVSKTDENKPKYATALFQRQIDRKKYFDSGDYQMACYSKSKLSCSTGEKIPTPETVPIKKTSITPPNKNINK